MNMMPSALFYPLDNTTRGGMTSIIHQENSYISLRLISQFHPSLARLFPHRLVSFLLLIVFYTRSSFKYLSYLQV